MSAFTLTEIEEFKTEALELLEEAEKSLLALSQESNFKSSFDTIFRGFHNLKGGAGMMELTKLQAHTHELETILMSFKTQGSIPKNYVDFFLKGIDAARVILDGEDIAFKYDVSSSKGESLDPGLNEFLEESVETIERISLGLQEIENGTLNKESIDKLYRDAHSLKGAAYLFSCNFLGEIAHAMESGLENIRNGTHLPTKKLLDGLFKSIEVLEKIIQRTKEQKTIEDFAPIIPVLVKALALATEQLPLAEIDESHHFEINEKNTESKIENHEGGSSVRVPVSLLDNLMTLMGEMVLVRNQVLQYSNKSEDLEFLSMSKRLNVVTSEIQEEMMKTRMQPIGNVLSKFNRVVRDVAQELKKNISIHITGSETELDKSLLEAVKDPLTHIIRNACDHGIETVEERISNGKKENGTVHVRAYHEGGQVIIEVSDDGRGLNKDKLITKAIEKNIISASKASSLTDKQVFELIFAPGFSTASTITNISGRGVGMDVVRTNVEKIGGVVEVSSKAGLGTSIKLKIPLTLAIVPALLVKCGEGKFAIPQVKLEELVRVEQGDREKRIEILHGSPVYRLRGKILPLIDLNNLLKINVSMRSEYKGGVFNIVVLNSDGISFGVIIDEVIDTADIVVKPINRLLKSLQVYSGATVLGDGSIALIFDVHGMAKLAGVEARHDQEEKASNEKVSNDIQDFVLIELDSPTKHALALNYVHRLEEFEVTDIEYSGSERVIRYRDQLLPIIGTGKSLGYGHHKNTGDNKLSVVVIERAGKFYGLEVNAILDTFSTTLHVRPSLREQTGIFGNISTSEELIVVIDPFEIITSAFGEEKKIANEDEIKATVLLVEDTVFFRRAMKETLENAGYSVIAVNDGQEALDLIEKNISIDIIVSDIEMPRVNGFQLAQAVRSLAKMRDIPMIAISSKADRVHVQKGLDSGFNSYLEKFQPHVLTTTVSGLLSAPKSRAS